MSARPAHAELERRLLGTGAMAPEWAGAFRAVPRSGFLPETMWPFDTASGQSLTVDRRTDPEAWYRWAETDVPITTQWDDGRHVGPGPGQVYTSSASMPSVVFGMLRDLDVHPGMRVLEIGTGTGWTAALLSHRLGGQRVTTVEVDPDVAEQASANLRRAGCSPRVVIADGATGCRDNAPYDRVIATCGMRRIPPEWIGQTRPGGSILVPWGTDYSPRDALALLVVAADGASARGRFTGPAQFMKARSQRLVWPRHEEYVTDWPGEVSTTPLARRDLVSDDPYGITEFALGLLVPDCTHTVHDQGDVSTAWFYGLTDSSWAAVRFTGEGDAEVYQGGPRRLWDEVEAAWRRWDGQGRPGWDRLGLTVTAEGEHLLWVDAPGRVLSGG